MIRIPSSLRLLRLLCRLFCFAAFLLIPALFPVVAFGQAANCQPPNLMVILDASNSMSNKVASQACTAASQCSPMPRTSQPTPGTTPVYAPTCASSRCQYARWDLARNALKEVVYQYGGTAGQTYNNRKIRFGMTAFSGTAKVEATIVSDPPTFAARLDARVLSGGTHYMNAFTAARNHLVTVINADAVKPRPTHIIFLTDGAPTDNCNDAPNMARDMFLGTGTHALKDNQGNVYKVKTYVIGFGTGIGATAQTCLTKIARLGGTQRCDPTIAGCVAYFYAEDGSELKKAMNTIVDNATQETCDGLDNDCDGQTDENNPGGGAACTTTLPGVCGPGVMTCQNGTLTCLPKQPAVPETCDGKDDDCDGQIDEDYPKLGKPCTEGSGTCEASGKFICRADGLATRCDAVAAPPQPEICDGKDNDCNGLIDEHLAKACVTVCGTGVELCQNGGWTGCTAPTPSAEVCDGQDNDCDGTVDNGLTRPCTTACGQGTETCVNGAWTFCDAKKPDPEICDGKDNDCNGSIDDGIPPQTCQGDCGQGTATCQNGTFAGCSGPKPEAEDCDGKDNDCNGKIDDNLTRSCKTACGEGKELCQNGQWTPCDAKKPDAEICDGKDNDCDGKIDNAAPCPTAGQTCVEGMCRGPCNNGECPRGSQCRNDVCYSITCDNVTCPADQVCKSGSCVDACLGVTCPSGQVCKNGSCVEDNCYGLGCPTGQICQLGKCVADPCFGITCPSGTFCRGGSCVGVCTSNQCPRSHQCVDGKCEPSSCARVTCPAEQRCVEGKCAANPCFGVKCPQGRLCVDGQCEDDPCLAIQCPQDFLCKEGQCTKDIPGGEFPKEENPPEAPKEGSNPSEPLPPEGIGSEDDGSATDQEQGDTQEGDKNSGGPNTNPDATPEGQAPGGCACQATPAPFSALLFLLLLFLAPFPLFPSARSRG